MGVSVNPMHMHTTIGGQNSTNTKSQEVNFLAHNTSWTRTQKQHVKMAQNSYNSQLAGHTECLILSATLQSRKARAYDN
jgi:hypothetical protein